MKILSLYIMGGFGHIKPAEALVEQFATLGIHGETYDVFSKDGKPNYDSANFYNFVSRSPLLSPLWNIFTRHDLLPSWVFTPVHALEVLQNKTTISKLKTIGQQNPDLIVTATHWTPALLAAHAFPAKTIFLYVTDIHPHGLWYINPHNIHYLVPMEETKIDITRYGVDPNRITVTSFPIHHEIIHQNHERFQKRLVTFRKRDPRLIEALVISGGAGTGRPEMTKLLENFLEPAKTNQIRLTLLASTPQLVIDLIAFCASHETHKNQIFVDRYTPQSLYPALTKAELLITKSGGDITFEALSEGLPIYALKDVGDHERLNRQYLELIGACKPLSFHHHPWDLIQSDLYSGEIISMAQASHSHGQFHRQNNTPKVILNLLKS